MSDDSFSMLSAETAETASTGSACSDDDELTPQHRVRLLVDNEFLSDIRFSVGSKGTLIYGHRYPLAVASDVFYRMFNDKADVSSAGGGEPVKVPDIEPETFLEMLGFVYYDEPTIEEDNVVELYFAAVKYNLVELKSRCLEFIEKEEASVLKVFMANEEHDFEELNKACLQTIRCNPLVMLRSPDFLQLPLKLVEEITNQSKLRCNDDQLLKALKKWSKNQDEATEQAEAYEKLAGIVKRRQELKRDFQCRKCMFFGSSSYTTSSGQGTFDVKALKPLELYGVGMYIGCEQKNKPVVVSVTVTSDGETIRQIQATLPVREDIYVYDLMFEKVSMEPNARVKIICDGPKWIDELKENNGFFGMVSLKKFAFYDRWLTTAGDSTALDLSVTRTNDHTAIAYILFQTQNE